MALSWEDFFQSGKFALDPGGTIKVKNPYAHGAQLNFAETSNINACESGMPAQKEFALSEWSYPLKSILTID